MLDEKDLKDIREIATEVATEVTTDITTKIVGENTKLILAAVAEMIKTSEVMLLDEMDRYDRKNERKFSELQKDMRELKDIYRMTKNESETIGILLKTLKDHDRRITRLEARTA